MCDPLGRNLQLPSWFAVDFLVYWIHWGRIFCFLAGNILSVLDLPRILWGRIFFFLTRDFLNMLGSIGEESSASSMGMILNMLNPLGKSLLLPY